MGVFDELEKAHQSLLQCGGVVFQHGTSDAIAAYTLGMRILATVIQKD